MENEQLQPPLVHAQAPPEASSAVPETTQNKEPSNWKKWAWRLAATALLALSRDSTLPPNPLLALLVDNNPEANLTIDENGHELTPALPGHSRYGTNPTNDTVQTPQTYQTSNTTPITPDQSINEPENTPLTPELDLNQPYTATLRLLGATIPTLINPTTDPEEFARLATHTTQALETANGSVFNNGHSGYDNNTPMPFELWRLIMENADILSLTSEKSGSYSLRDIINAIHTNAGIDQVKNWSQLAAPEQNQAIINYLTNQNLSPEARASITLTDAHGQEIDYKISDIQILGNHPINADLARNLGVSLQTTPVDLITVGHDLPKVMQLLNPNFNPQPGAVYIIFCGWQADGDTFNTTATRYVFVLNPDGSPAPTSPNLDQANLSEALNIHNPNNNSVHGLGLVNRGISQFALNQMPENIQRALSLNGPNGEFLRAVNHLFGLDPNTINLNFLQGKGADFVLEVLRYDSTGGTIMEFDPETNTIHFKTASLRQDAISWTQMSHVAPEEYLQMHQLEATIAGWFNYGNLSERYSAEEVNIELRNGNLRAMTEFFQQAFKARYGLKVSPYSFMFGEEVIDPTNLDDLEFILAKLNELADTSYTLDDLLTNWQAWQKLDDAARDCGYTDGVAGLFGMSRGGNNPLDIQPDDQQQLYPGCKQVIDENDLLIDHLSQIPLPPTD